MVNIFNHETDALPLVSQETGGGSEKTWNILSEGKIIEHQYPEGLTMGEYLDVIIKANNRCDFPITLNPQTASFNEVAIHGKLRQRLQISTIEKNLRYARFMETHTCPVDFRNPTFKNFLKHMDYRESIENATPHALIHEWKAMQMFLRAYGIKISDWQYKPPTAPKSHKRILPYPETVHNFFTHIYKNSERNYETKLYQYLFFFGFITGVRIPSELVNLKIDDVHFESKNRGYIVVRESKKHDSERVIIPERALLNSKVHKSLKNWLESWRPRVVNELSDDSLFLQPSGKPFSVRHLGLKLSKMGKLVWKDFQPYDMRHWCAVARLIRTKIETGGFDCYQVKNWLGHEKLATTEGYIKYAERYYRDFPVDWIACALKSFMTGMHRENGNVKNQQNAFLGSVGNVFSCWRLWARRDLNSRPPGYQPGAPTNLSYEP